MDLPAFGLWRTVNNDLVLPALISASSSSFLASNLFCSIWSSRSQRSSLCLLRFVGAGGSLRGLALGVWSWLTAVAPGWTCFACSGFPIALSKGMSNWKPEGNAGGFFDLLPAAEAIGKLERSIKDDEKHWIGTNSNEWDDQGTWGKAKARDQKGTIGGINYWIPGRISVN